LPARELAEHKGEYPWAKTNLLSFIQQKLRFRMLGVTKDNSAHVR